MILFTSDLLTPAMHVTPTPRFRLRHGAPAFGCRTARARMAPRLVPLPVAQADHAPALTGHQAVDIPYDRAA